MFPSLNVSRCRRLAVAAWLLLPLTLTDCSGSRFDREQELRANAFPANYKPELLAFLHTYLNDPTGVRDAAISEPAMAHVGRRDRYAVCVRFNAKNGQGSYNGVATGMAVFRNGRFEQFTEEPREVKEPCVQAAFTPFPELEHMTR